jgi:NitT/TauT family transport system ATP-binding protein
MNAAAGVPEIEIAGVSKQYGNARAVLQSIDLKIGKREFVSIIGSSGCGKSTILKLIAGLAVPTTGTIRVDGMPPQNARESISFVFQDATLLPWRTVRQNVVLGLELDGMAREARNAKVDAVLSLVGLDHVADSFPRQLSGGMKMRVSIARALATRPQLLLLDEPFAALDEMTRDRINEELLRLREEQNWTALFVTHSVAEAVFLSTRILILAPNPGRIVHDVSIDLPFPRTEATRRSEDYDRTIAEVSRTLRSITANTAAATTEVAQTAGDHP